VAVTSSPPHATGSSAGLAGLALPVHPALRGVQLSAAHAQQLFGADVAARLAPLMTLGCGRVAATGTVQVRGPTGALPVVRVIVPASAPPGAALQTTASQTTVAQTTAAQTTAAQTTVWLQPRDLGVLGLEGGRLPAKVAGSQGVSLVGPAGVVVLAEGVVAAERVCAPEATLRTAGLSPGGNALAVVVGAGRRTERVLPVVADAALCGIFIGEDGCDLAVFAGEGRGTVTPA
jgi:propanediol utilization protein